VASQPFPVQATESAHEMKQPRSITRGPPGGRRRTHAEASVSPRRRKPRSIWTAFALPRTARSKCVRPLGYVFLEPDKKRPIRTSAVRLRRKGDVGDALAALSIHFLLWLKPNPQGFLEAGRGTETGS
jgi:hypothetical protein